MDAADRREPVVIGLAAGNGTPLELARQVADELPRELGERFDGLEWKAEVVELKPADLSASSRELVESVRRCLLARGWELAVGLTDLPLRAGRRPVTAHASATDGVGLVSVPALGVVGVGRRLQQAVVHLVEGLVGEAAARGSGPRRSARIAARLRELASPLGHAKVHHDGSVRFLAAAVGGNLRLLVGMVKANQPTRVMLRLSSAVVAALGTAAYSLASSNIWQLADRTSWGRLIGLIALSGTMTCVALVVAHGLWERSSDPTARERVVLFNVATTATLVLGVVSLYLALLVISALGAGALISPRLLAARLHHPVGVLDYIRLACLAASLAAVGGALGSLVESDLSVREATYRSREDERTEAED